MKEIKKNQQQDHSIIEYIINELKEIQKNLLALKSSLAAEKFQIFTSNHEKIQAITKIVNQIETAISLLTKSPAIDPSNLIILFSGIKKRFRSELQKNIKNMEFLILQFIKVDTIIMEVINISPADLQKKIYDQELLTTITYVYENHFSKPYTRAKQDKYPHDEFIKLDNKIIYRPNHALAHAVRVVFYVAYVIAYYGKHAKEQQFKNFCNTLTKSELLKIQKAMLFLVSGRESDLGFSDNPKVYMEYRQRCGEQFAAFAKQDGWSKQDIKKFQHLIVYYGVDQYPKHYPDNSQNNHYLSHLMQLSHNLDLLRCEDPDSYLEDTRNNNRELIEKSPTEGDDFYKLMLLAQSSLEATGDRFFTRLEKNKLIFAPFDKQFYSPKKFIKSNTDPQSCFSALFNLNQALMPELFSEQKEGKKQQQSSDPEQPVRLADKAEIMITAPSALLKTKPVDAQPESNSSSLSFSD